MFGSSLQRGDCCLYPAAFQVNFLFPVNVAWQLLTWVPFCCLQQRFNHSHTGTREVGGRGSVTLWVLLRYWMLIRQTAGKERQFYCRFYLTVRIWSWIFHSTFAKKTNNDSGLRGYTFTANRTKSTVQQHLQTFGCHGGLISRHSVVSTWLLYRQRDCICFLFNVRIIC